MNNVKFIFEEPSYGWMEVYIITNDDEVCFEVSDVPCNSLQQLVICLINLLSYNDKQEVEWSLEPECWTWSFRKFNKDIIFTTKYVEDDKLEVKENCFNLIKSIYRGLSKLRTNEIWDNQNFEHWSWVFPDREMKILKHKIKENKDV